MNQTSLLTGLIAALLTCVSAVASDEERQKGMDATERPRALIVYLSRTNNTKAVAEMIQEQVSADILELELQTPYPENYEAIVSQVDAENEAGFMPPLANAPDDLAQYDTVYVGFPTWDMQLPPPMKTFLTKYDLSGKTIAPFNTHGGYGAGSSFETVRELCTGCRVVKGFSVKGGLERDGIYLAIEGDRAEEVRVEVKEWLRSIGENRP